MKLKLHVDDYLTAIAGVALLRIQEWAMKNLPEWQSTNSGQKPIQLNDDLIEVHPSVLDHLPRWYFQCLMDKYSIKRREEERLRSLVTSKYLTPQDKLLRLRDSMNNNIKKLVKYFPDSDKLRKLQSLLDEIRTMKAGDLTDERMDSIIDGYLGLLSIQEFEERLTLNVLRSFLHNSFFGQTSMLQKTLSGSSLQEHIERMQRDFVEPVKLDYSIRQWLAANGIPDKNSQQQLVDMLRVSNRNPYKRWSNEIKKLEPQEIPEYLNARLRCSFEEEWFATMNFEEMTFAPLGISGKMSNFNWDHTYHQMPISNWIRLVLFMAPAGLTSFTRLRQVPFTSLSRDEYETFYCFVYRDGTPRSIYEDNKDLANMEQNESFERLIPKLVQREEYKAKLKLQSNIQILEFYSDLSMKKTILNDYHVPRHVLIYFNSGESKLSYMHRPIRELFLRLILNSIDPISSIWNYMRSVINGKGTPFSAYLAIKERWIIEQLKKEGVSKMGKVMQKNAGYIYYISQEGLKIRKALERKADKQSESTDYVSSGSKRAAGIAHRLLNAARSGDKHLFLDTTIRLYLSVGSEVPTSLLNILHEERVDFATWAGAFITGLLGSDRRDPSNEHDVAGKPNEESEVDQ